jgi:heat shock protein HslJ
MIRFVAVLVGLLLLAACGEKSTGNDASAQGKERPLEGRTFVVTTVTVGGAPHHIVKGTQIRLTFDNGDLAVSAGCNSMSGSYTYAGDDLKVGPIGGTEMGCEQRLMDQDAWVAQLFQQPVRIGTDPLTLTSGDVVLELADRRDVSPDAPLTGTTWTLDSLITGDTVSSVPDGVAATLTIGDGGKVVVNLGCNRGTGMVGIEDARLTWKVLATTKMSCVDERPQLVERAMLSVLSGQTSFTIVERSLTITSGSEGLGFRAG